MKDPTGIFNVEIDPELLGVLKMIPKQEMDQFLQRCKEKNYERLDGATSEQERLTVQVRAQFVEEWRKFFKTLLTKPQ